MIRRISDAGVAEIKKMESVEPYVYTDQAGFQTIGVGHKIVRHEFDSGVIVIDGEEVWWMNGLKPGQIDGLLRQDLSEAEATVSVYVKVPLTDNEYAALVSLCFNIGSAAFKGSSVVRVLNEGYHNSVPDKMRMWNKITIQVVQPDGSRIQKKVVSNGLVNRREAEIELWLRP
jgi:lysozyme